jgi:hypothetical protein
LPSPETCCQPVPNGFRDPWEASHEVTLYLGVWRRPLVSLHWFSDPSSTFAHCRPVGLQRWPSRSFQQTPGCRMQKAPGTSAHEVTSSSESHRLTAAANDFACFAAPLLRFLAPSAQSTSRVHSTRVCLTRYVPPPGFRTLLTACSSAGCPALFHAGALMEFLPLQSFSLVRSSDASRRPNALLPFIRFLPPHRLPEEAPRTRRRSCIDPVETSRNLVRTVRRPQQRGRKPGSTSGPCSPERVRCVAAAVRPTAGSMLSWGSHLDTVSASTSSTTLANTATPEPLNLYSSTRLPWSEDRDRPCGRPRSRSENQRQPRDGRSADPKVLAPRYPAADHSPEAVPIGEALWTPTRRPPSRAPHGGDDPKAAAVDATTPMTAREPSSG